MQALWEGIVRKVVKHTRRLFTPSTERKAAHLLALPADSPLYGLLSAPELVRLRATCSRSRAVIDSLPLWRELFLELDEINHVNVGPWTETPFVLRKGDEGTQVQEGEKEASAAGDDTKGLEDGGKVPEEDEDEDEDEDEAYNEDRKHYVTGFASKDPRIQASFASLKPFDQCAKLYTFTRAAVERIQKQLPFPPKHDVHGEDPYRGYVPPTKLLAGVMDATSEKDRVDRIWEVYDGLDENSIPSMRFCAIMRLAELNVLMSDMSCEGGTYILRNDDKDGMIDVGDRDLHRAVDCYFGGFDEYGNDVMGDADLWGDDNHIIHLATQRAAGDRLRHLLGDVLCERIEVLGEARQNLRYFLQGLWIFEWEGETDEGQDSEEDSPAERKKNREEDLDYFEGWASGQVSDKLLDKAHATFIKSRQEGGDDTDSDKDEIEDSEGEMDEDEAYLRAWADGDIQDELLELAFQKWNEEQGSGGESSGSDTETAVEPLDRERKAVDQGEGKEEDEKAQGWNDPAAAGEAREEVAAIDKEIGAIGQQVKASLDAPIEAREEDKVREAVD